MKNQISKLKQDIGNAIELTMKQEITVITNIDYNNLFSKNKIQSKVRHVINSRITINNIM